MSYSTFVRNIKVHLKGRHIYKDGSMCSFVQQLHGAKLNIKN